MAATVIPEPSANANTDRAAATAPGSERPQVWTLRPMPSSWISSPPARAVPRTVQSCS